MSPPWTLANRTGYSAIGFATSRAVRKPGVPQGCTAERLLADYVAQLQHHFIFSTWGTYCGSVVRQNLRGGASQQDSFGAYQAYTEALRLRREWPYWEPDMEALCHGHCLRPGRYGGIIEVTERLEKAMAGEDRIWALIYLSDPDDQETSYPEDRAMVRSAIRNDAVLLLTYRAAAHWAAFEPRPEQLTASRETPPNTHRTFEGPEGGTGRAELPDGSALATDPEGERLALIAHDGRKLDMCRWVVQHRRRIRRFERIITTGTTGEWVKRFLEAAGVRPNKITWIDPRDSGPSGGDVEIAGEMLRGEVTHVVFFIDPMAARAHEADVQSLLRTGCMPDVTTKLNLRVTEAAATSWICTVEPQ